MAKTLLTNNTDLTRDKRFSFLTEDVISTGSTFRVQSILGFEGVGTSSGQIVCIGEIGEERTELLRTANTTGYNPSQAYKEITLRDAMNFDHPQDTKVTIVDWNRVEAQWSASASGTKSTLFAYPLALQPDQKETVQVDVSQTTGFYFVRFNETVGNSNSDWSDAIPYGGYDDNSVFSIKIRAVRALGEEIDGNVITHEFLNEALWEARREYHQAPGKRPFRRNFNKIIGTALTGSYRIELPIDAEAPYGAENIYGVRIGPNANMSYYDKKEWDFDQRGRSHSTLDLPYTRDVSTSLWLANGRDFSQSGSVNIEGMTIGYTKVSGSNNSMTITSHGSYPSASGGSDVWQNTTFGLPYKFTVWADPQGSAYIYFNMPIDTAYIGMNIYSDYYRTLLGYDSDGDVLDEPKYDMFVDFLKYKIKGRRTKQGISATKSKNGRLIIDDADYQMWEERKNTALATERLSADIRIFPETPNDIPY